MHGARTRRIDAPSTSAGFESRDGWLYLRLDAPARPGASPWDPLIVEIFDRILPIVTLVLGGASTFFLQRSNSGYSRRVAAGDLLADMRRQVWSRDVPDGWVQLQVYLGRLRVHLREVGVPELIISSLSNAADAFWNATEEDPEHGLIMVAGDEISAELDRAEARVHLWLRNDWSSRFGQRKQRAQVLRYVVRVQQDASLGVS